MPRQFLSSSIYEPPTTSASLIIDAASSDNCYLIPTSRATSVIMPTEGTPFTWAFWAKIKEPVSQSTIPLLTCFNSSNAVKLKIQVQHSTNERLYIVFNDSSSGNTQAKHENFSSKYIDNEWHHFLFRWDGETTTIFDNLDVFMDGVKIEMTSMSGAATDLDDLSGGTMVFFSGARPATANTGADIEEGSIDEMVWYNLKLSDSQCRQLYNDGRYFNPANAESDGLIYRHATMPPSGSLKGYWTFDTGQITITETNVTASDSSGHDHFLLNNDYGFIGTGNARFNSGSACPLGNDQVFRPVFRSGFVSKPVRQVIRDVDALSGQYPTIKKTGDSNRKGNFNIRFDDRRTINFVEFDNIEYLTQTVSGSVLPVDGAESIATPSARGNSLAGPGVLKSGITDNIRLLGHRTLASINYENHLFDASESSSDSKIKPFNESRILLKTSSFYMTGTAETVFPGFSSQLSDKTIIKIELPNTRDVLLGTEAEFEPDDSDDTVQYQAYYNFDTSDFETRRGLGSTHEEGDALKGFGSASLGFGIVGGLSYYSASRMGLASDHGSNAGTLASNGDMTYVLYPDSYYQGLGTPTDAYGFPDASKFHATSSLLLNMKDYINHPFLLEKVTARFKISFGSTFDASDEMVRLVSGIGSINSSGLITANSTLYNSYGEILGPRLRGFNVFLLRQYNVSEQSLFTVTNSDVKGSSLDLNFYTGTNKTNRELVAYGQAIIKSGSLLSYVSDNANLDDIFSKTPQDLIIDMNEPNNGGTYEADVILEFQPKNLSPKKHVGQIQQERLSGGSTSRTTSILGYAGNARNHTDITSPRSLISLAGDKGKTNAVKVAVGSGVSTNGGVPLESFLVNESDKSISPYFLFPEDQLILGIEVNPSQNLWSSGEHGISDLTIKQGTFDLQLFGSLVKNNSEHHDTLNQHLTTESVHEHIHELVIDQFQTNRRNEFTGSYLDRESSDQSGGIGSIVKSKIGVGDNDIISGSLQRFISIKNPQQRLYDTVLVDIDDMFQADGKKLIQSTFSGLPEDVRFRTGFFVTSQNSINYQHHFWHAIFPFEPRYHSAKRVVSQKNLIYKIPIRNVVHNMEGSAILYSFLGNPISTGSVEAMNKASLLAAFSYGPSSFNRHRGDDSRIHRPIGFKYGIKNVLPEFTKNIFRYDKYGNYADMLEQSKDARYFLTEDKTITDGPLRIRFVVDDDENDQYIVLNDDEILENTFESSNISIHCTSSMPFFDDSTPRNRSEAISSNAVIQIVGD